MGHGLQHNSLKHNTSIFTLKCLIQTNKRYILYFWFGDSPGVGLWVFGRQDHSFPVQKSNRELEGERRQHSLSQPGHSPPWGSSSGQLLVGTAGVPRGQGGSAMPSFVEAGAPWAKWATPRGSQTLPQATSGESLEICYNLASRLLIGKYKASR